MNAAPDIDTVLGATRVIPVLTADSVHAAVGAARALVAGGLHVIEVTLRTESAFDALHAIAGEIESAIVGVGTVVDPGQFEAATRHGARFAVSPGFSTPLLAAARESRLPWLPAAQTLSEVMTLRELGFVFQKFFPARVAGGVAMLRAIGGVLPDVRFCPTGGIDEVSLPGYLALRNVQAVGGSWMLPRDAMDRGDWGLIEKLAAGARVLAARPSG